MEPNPVFTHPFSGGQRQRLCIARACDASGNPSRRSSLGAGRIEAQVPALIDDVRRFNLAVLFITHDLRSLDFEAVASGLPILINPVAPWANSAEFLT